nr:reverse transcriptase domain-containing protein [Tanacetum cinerariifolium]
MGGRTGDDQGIGENGGIDKVLDFSMVIAQQLQYLLPTIIAQVGNHTCNIHGDVRSANVKTRGLEAAVGMTWEDFKGLVRKQFCLNNELQKLETKFWCYAMVRVGHSMYTDRFHKLSRNGSLRKYTEKRGNGRELSRDGNVRDDDKRSRNGRAFSIIANPVRKSTRGGQGRGNNGNQLRGGVFMMGAKEARQDLNIMT